jgi:predicted flap endonuclease-1-like 5' DNA nuclease
MALLLQASLEPDAGTEPLRGGSGGDRPRPPAPPRAMSLHISKLRGITYQVRQRLKRQGITYTHQLIEAARDPRSCRRLAAQSGIEEAMLERLVCRADLARINGVGAIFADMLELLGVDGTLPLARREPAALHAELCRLNAVEQLARRAPTPEEVQSWVGQARALLQASTGGLADAAVSGSS